MTPNPTEKRTLHDRTKASAQLQTERTNQRPARDPDIAPRLERKWFEFDRSAVLRQIDLVQNAIDQNAAELGVVAVEGVFEKPLSDGLLRASRALHLIAHELGALHGLVAHTTRYPKGRKKRS
jgi:hypothetical protein